MRDGADGSGRGGPGRRPGGAGGQGRQDSQDEQRERGEIIRRAAPYMGLGMTMAASVLLGVLGGQWLDNRLGTAPWLTVIGLLLGVGTGFYNLIVVLVRRPRE
jgi:ATP synthase protein I